MSNYSEEFLKVMESCYISLSKDEYKQIRAKNTAAADFRKILSEKNDYYKKKTVRELQECRDKVDAFGYELTKEDHENLFCVLTSAHLLALIRERPLEEQFPKNVKDVQKLQGIAEVLKEKDPNIRASNKDILMGNKTFRVNEILDNPERIYAQFDKSDKIYDADFAILREIVANPELIDKAQESKSHGYRSFQNKFGTNFPVDKVQKLRTEHPSLFK
eukprot:NODE_30_length_32972_cov_0.541052.p12 type:complete len:218 gc:universal NODE_30_length_32972_cov_0.541052:14710-15363(+)